MGFTKETARAAAAKRREKAAARISDIAAPAPADEPKVPPSFHGGLPPVERAEVVVPPPPPAPEPEPASEVAPTADPAKAEVVEVTEGVFSPEVTKMLANIAFDTVGVVTGKPHIWKLDDEEIEPLAKPIGHQLSRIPLVKAIGPDNTELAVVVLGMGVIVTKRLNAHADENQREAQEKARRLAAGEAPTRRDIARSSAPPAPAEQREDFASEGGGVHIGLPATGSAAVN